MKKLELATLREGAKIEFSNNKSIQKKCIRRKGKGSTHLIFDFAKKVLLPKLQNQPGQLHFVTGRKFYLFGISVCKNCVCFRIWITRGIPA